MPRPPREELAGGLFHVYARGNNRRRIFPRLCDRITYLSMAGETVRLRGWQCMAYCLMDNHVHLLIETPSPNLATGMQRLHGKYAQRLNARYRQSGHVFQGRYGCVRVESDEQLWATLRYIALNPVEAGVCAHPGDCDWSSYSEIVRGRSPDLLDISHLLSYFESAGGNALDRYRDLVES